MLKNSGYFKKIDFLFSFLKNAVDNKETIDDRITSIQKNSIIAMFYKLYPQLYKMGDMGGNEKRFIEMCDYFKGDVPVYSESVYQPETFKQEHMIYLYSLPFFVEEFHEVLDFYKNKDEMGTETKNKIISTVKTIQDAQLSHTYVYVYNKELFTVKRVYPNYREYTEQCYRESIHPVHIEDIEITMDLMDVGSLLEIIVMW